MPFFHKPPLFYWITAVALKLFGATVLAARAASLLAAWMTGMGLYLFLRHHGSRWQIQWNNWALLILGIMPFFFVGAQFANTDMLVAGMICCTILAGAHAVLQADRGQPWRHWVWLACILAALGVLSKGLIGAVLPAGVLFWWLVWQRHWQGLLRLALPSGLAVFAAVVLPWFIWMERHYPGFFHYFFIYQQFQRFTQTGFNNQMGVWFYPVVLLVLALPWTLWLPLPLWRLWHIKHTAQEFKQPVPMQSAPALLRLFATWVLVILLFFSIPKSKLVGYILPVLPALSALLAYRIAMRQQQCKRLACTLYGSMALCLLVLTLGTFLPVANKKSAAGAAQQMQLQFQPDDQLVMLDGYQYDLPFYLQARQPVWVVSDWPAVALSKRDNWQKELHESAAFNTRLGEKVLLTHAQLQPRLCQKLQSMEPVWLFARNHALINTLPSVASNIAPYWQQDNRATDSTSVWRLQGKNALAALQCAPALPSTTALATTN